jgi:hypothetical protein
VLALEVTVNAQLGLSGSHGEIGDKGGVRQVGEANPVGLQPHHWAPANLDGEFIAV